MYGKDGPYSILLYGFLIGAVFPIPFYFLTKRFPHSKVIRSFHSTVFLAGCLSWTPYNLSHSWPAVPVAYVFQIFIRKRYLAWWQKYNYILSTALDCGVAIAALVTFFALQWPEISIDWWGNDVVAQGADAWPGLPHLLPPDRPGSDRPFWGPGPGEFH
jgi:hypothetical protein